MAHAALQCAAHRVSIPALRSLCYASSALRQLARQHLAIASSHGWSSAPAARQPDGRRVGDLRCRSSGGGSGRPKRVLGIESSCDDTGVAIISSDGEILGEALATQADIHAPWGGVVPKLAQEAHEAAMGATLNRALQAAGIEPHELDAVAVTIGPGLSLCLRVGVMAARQLAAAHSLPLVPVHHMEAHALVAGLFERQAQLAAHSNAAASGNGNGNGNGASASSGAAAAHGAGGAGLQYPFLCLLVSGGHNLLLLVRGVGEYEQLGATLDDALGEAYDKVARLLGLPAVPSGGAALEALAVGGDPLRFRFSVPLKKHPNCNFSYAGLKTAVRLAVEAEVGPEPEAADQQVRADIAASFQHVAVRHLAERTARAAAWAREACPELSTLVVAGGVAANRTVRAELQRVADEAGLRLVVPPPRYCTDNGVMVAWAGLQRYELGLWEPAPAEALEDDAWIELRPRWPLTDDIDKRSSPAMRSMRKQRLHTSLTQLTREALAQGAQGGAHAPDAGAAAAAS